MLTAAAVLVGSTSWLVDTNNLTGYAQVVEERTTTGGTTSASSAKVYTYGTALLAHAETPGTNPGTPTLRYFSADGHGSTRELTNAGGEITDRYDYDAFGNLTFSSGTTANAYRYSGEQYDVDLGLYYLRARYLNPDSGRFWSMDSYQGKNREPASLHKYLYGAASPTFFRDRSGNAYSLAEVMAATKISATLGGIAGVGYGYLKTKSLKGAVIYGAFGAVSAAIVTPLIMLSGGGIAAVSGGAVSTQAATFAVGAGLNIAVIQDMWSELTSAQTDDERQAALFLLAVSVFLQIESTRAFIAIAPKTGGSSAGKDFSQSRKSPYIERLRQNMPVPCSYCGENTTLPMQSTKGVTPPENQFNLDHYIPKGQGGNSSAANGVPSCRACNLAKSDSIPQTPIEWARLFTDLGDYAKEAENALP